MAGLHSTTLNQADSRRNPCNSTHRKCLGSILQQQFRYRMTEVGKALFYQFVASIFVQMTFQGIVIDSERLQSVPLTQPCRPTREASIRLISLPRTLAGQIRLKYGSVPELRLLRFHSEPFFPVEKKEREGGRERAHNAPPSIPNPIINVGSLLNPLSSSDSCQFPISCPNLTTTPIIFLSAAPPCAIQQFNRYRALSLNPPPG